MSQFEFLRNLPVGQYLPIESAVARLDPRARIAGITAIFLGITFSMGLPGLLIGCFSVVAGLVVARIPLRYALRTLSTPLPFILILVMLQIIWNGGDDRSATFFSFSGFSLTLGDIQLGMILFLRFFGLILCLGLLSFTTSTQQLTQGLYGLLRPLKWINLQVDDFVMMVQITFRFLPLLAQSAERIAKAQASRGAEWGKGERNLLAMVRRIIPVLIPLFVTSLHRANQMALAMDSRGYGSGERSSQAEMKFGIVDGLAIAIAVIMTVLILVV